MSLAHDPPTPWRVPEPLPDRYLSERLELRHYQESHARALFEACEASRAALLPWLPWATTSNRTVEECAETIARFTAKRARTDPPADDFVIATFDRETGDLVGGTGLHRINLKTSDAEIGYWIRADRRREGLCTEATRALITWAFRAPEDGGWGLRRIRILCAEPNVASAGVPARLGLRRESHTVRDRYVAGVGLVDTLSWGVLKDEWS